MKRAVLSVFLLGLVSVFTACGGGSNSRSPNDTASHIAKRAFVSNNFNGDVQIVDTSNDQLSSTFSIFVGTRPTFMLLSGDKSTTIVFDANNNAVNAIENSSETRTAAIQLDNWSESVAIRNDGQTGFAAVRLGISAVGAPQGEIEILDFKNNALIGRIAAPATAPNTRWIALDHAGKNLLAFSDTADIVSIVDTTQTTPTALPLALPANSVSRPVAAYFSADDTKAYILNCGLQCGGTAPASVTELTIATNAVRNVPVASARIGLLNGTSLYVAGSAPPGSTGQLTVVDTTAMTASAPVTIGPGDHWRMAQAGSKIWIGARNCVDPVSGVAAGCLSTFDTGSHTPTIGPVKGDVTGMAPINGRNVIYVVEGAEVRVYDINSANEIPNLIDIVGIAYDVVSLT